MTASQTCADLYLRLSDMRREEQLDGREAKLRALAAALGWSVYAVIIENDLTPGNGRSRSASAFKRQKMTTPSGRTELRVNRPGFRQVLADITSGAVTAVLAEDLDRACRDPRDLEDLVDACAARKASARSLSGSLTLTDGGTDAEITMARMMVTMANKSSRDTARRVADAKQRLAGQSFAGGVRRFGYRHDPDAPEYRKTLIVVEDEAAVIRQAAADILDRGISVTAVAKGLRARGVPTAGGGYGWTATSVKAALIKPTVAGLVFTGGVEHEAPWPAILDRDIWERLRAKLCDPARDNDPERRTGKAKATANEPKWLVSMFARCGVCHGPLRVTSLSWQNRGGDRTARRVYSGAHCAHLSRSTQKVDAHIADLIVARLDKPDIRHGGLLKPPPRPGTGVQQLRAEKDKILRRLDNQAGMHARGQLSDRAFSAGQRTGTERLAVLDAQIAAAASKPDPLPEFRGDVPALQVWDGLTVARRRAVVKTLVTSVTINRANRGSQTFDPSKVVVVAAADVPWPELETAA